MLSSVKRGRERIWAVEPQPLTAASDYLTALSTRWDRAIGRLQTYLEAEEGEAAAG